MLNILLLHEPCSNTPPNYAIQLQSLGNVHVITPDVPAPCSPDVLVAILPTELNKRLNATVCALAYMAFCLIPENRKRQYEDSFIADVQTFTQFSDLLAAVKQYLSS